MFTLRPGLLALGLVASLATAGAAQQKFDIPLKQISLDKAGELTKPRVWDSIQNELKEKRPSHVIVLVHGWNNNQKDSESLFSKMTELLTKSYSSADSTPRNFRPIVIGVHWPSEIGENSFRYNIALQGVSLLIEQLLDKKFQSPYAALEAGLKDKENGEFAMASILAIANKFFPDVDLKEFIASKENLEKIVQVATFYRMKNRAGLVGEKGVSKLLQDIRDSCPDTSLHLVGHSFGCKVLLSALAAKECKVEPNSLILLQGAVSSQCFAEKLTGIPDEPCGAYCCVLKRVKGPIVATYSSGDTELKLAYLLASKSAGHTGELTGRRFGLKLDAFHALGAKGCTEGQKVKMSEGRDGYEFGPGLYSMDADGVIRDHSDIRTDAVAWLIHSVLHGKRP